MNKYNPNIHRRKSIRLKGYDYSQPGLYFITICVDRLKNSGMMPFGHVENGKMILNDAGKMVENEWLKLPERFKNIKLHEYVVMPNHFHAILEIVGATLVVAQNNENNNIVVVQNNENNNIVVTQNNENIDIKKGQPQGIAPTGTESKNKPKTVGDMAGAFHSIVTVKYINGVKLLGWQPFNQRLLQRNYYEHIIRNEQSYQRISNYIINNPKNWGNDKFFEK